MFIQGYSFVGPSVLFQKNTLFNELPSVGASELVSRISYYNTGGNFYALWVSKIFYAILYIPSVVYFNNVHIELWNTPSGMLFNL